MGSAERRAQLQAIGRGRHITELPRRSRNRSATARRGVPVRAVPVPELTPDVGQRAQDRVLLASGVVLGVVGLTAIRVLSSGVRGILASLRQRRD